MCSLPVLIQYLHMCTCAFVERLWKQGVFVRGPRMAHAWLQPSEAHVGNTNTLTCLAWLPITSVQNSICHTSFPPHCAQRSKTDYVHSKNSSANLQQDNLLKWPLQ